MRFRRHPSIAKTLSFAVIHLALATVIGWLLTGTFVFGALLAFVEPVVNTVVIHELEKQFPAGPHSRRAAILKSGLLGVFHLFVAMAVGWALTRSFVVATVYAFIEPAANAVAHYFFEQWWDGRTARQPAPQAS